MFLKCILFFFKCIYRSKVFSNISKILSHSEEYQDVCEDTQPGVSEVYIFGNIILNP